MRELCAQKVIYTRKWFYSLIRRFLRDTLRSLAFGLLISVSLLLFILLPLFYISENSHIYIVRYSLESAGPSDTVIILLYIFGALPLCVLCWWAALEVADDSYWENSVPTIWDNQKAQWLEYTVKYVRYLESQGRPVDTSIVLSKDIRAAAHKLIDSTDEPTLRFLLAAIMASNIAKQSSACRKLESY